LLLVKFNINFRKILFLGRLNDGLFFLDFILIITLKDFVET